MAVTHGMDLAGVEDLGRFLQANADLLRSLTGDLNTTVHASVWGGADSESFRGVMWPSTVLDCCRSQTASTASARAR